ncbi:uncharacterized protein BP5553_09490 [Venustampulla echinocandica]|uniref:Xylanolytic transcriptional activator regulatory domain-containing protein n=1 Tax=Venustampulla echinocandica TaxID=2656787 RepID=A0A370TCV6_9HELO|nr:uncharacterized protein BP5553_09490 [Venustampulla echinocandica]RDL32088.1 hypothetical protein BP5553_09490 [Venustampulla echinocandica]
MPEMPEDGPPRKRTDTRVAELEREVQAMRALFDRKSPLLPEKTGPVDVNELSSLGVSISMNRGSPSSATTVGSLKVPGLTCSARLLPVVTSEINDSPDQNVPSPSVFSPDADVIDKGIVSMKVADKLFRTYTDDLFQNYPAVAFPPGTLAENMRRTKPTLFLAVIAAAAAKTDPHLYRILHSEVLAAYAYRTVINSEKSLELVQALIVTAVWYYPPGRLSQLKFYEYIHMAVTMAIDIGLGTNPKASRRRQADSDKSSPEVAQNMTKDEGEIERRRTFLACYLISAGVAMNMRRPNFLRYSSWMNDCIAYLSLHGSSATLDNTLVAWAILLQITEEIGSSFSFDDASNIANLAEPQVKLMLNGFEQKLQAWRERFDSNGINGTRPHPLAHCMLTIKVALLLAYHHTQIYLHEVAIHDDHPIEDLTPPYKLDRVLSIEPNIHASSSYIKPVSIIISSVHCLLDMMLNMDVETMRAIPIFNYVRMTYAILVLTKLYISSKTLESQIGSVLEPGILKLGPCLESLIEKLSLAVGPMECRAPFTFLGILLRLRTWYTSQEKEENFKPPVGLQGDLDHCWLPSPPDISKKQAPVEATVLVASPPLAQLQGITPNQAENLRSMGLMELATMQPLPSFDLDWGNPDINQFSDFGGIDAHPEYNDWMPDVELHKPLDDPADPVTLGWEISNTNNSFL